MKKTKKRDENKVKYGTISLPLPLIDKIKEKIKGTGMPSVSSYVAFVLRQILSSSSESSEVFDKKEREEIKKRLASLGY
ncbi:MAG: CopG family transcriptional regulator [Nanoarchaeota archaeon]|nr:CopG family transcriptional regulator [Nanoarchaeota archaeon]